MRSAHALMLAGVLLSGCTATPAVPPGSPRPQSASHASMQARFPSPIVVSVLYFEDRSHLPELAWLRKGLSDMLVGQLARNPSLLVVQRERLEEVIREQAFQLSGRVADESAVRVGRLTGATVLVTGSIAVMEGMLRLDAQVLNVEQGTVLGTAMAEGPLAAVQSVTRSLGKQVMELFPGSAGEQVVKEEEGGAWESAKANQAGETLRRAGKMFEALEQFERALARHPDDPTLRSNYSKTVRNLSTDDIIKMSEIEPAWHNDRVVANRITERLTGGGIEAEIGPSRSEAQADGSVTLFVPVRFRLDARTVAAVRDSVQALGGRIEEKPCEEGPIELALPARSALNREFVAAVSRPRRIFLRLLSSAGQTVAVYSELLDWRWSVWVAPVDGERVRVLSRKILSSKARIIGLTPQQAAVVTNMKVTVDGVPNERALVRVDLSEPANPAGDEMEPRASEPGTKFSRPLSSDYPSAALRTALERAWNPPVSERSWGHRYLPGNERTAAVIMVFSAGDGRLRADARLARPSGDAGFDAACIEAVRTAVPQWERDSDEWRLWLEKLSGTETTAPAPGEGRELKARVHFRLRKDVPALNLIGAHDFLAPQRPSVSNAPPF